MPNPIPQIPIAHELPKPEPTPAELSAAGHWAETQVIEILKQSSAPRVGLRQGELVPSKPRTRTRVRRLLSYLRG